ncbi:Rod shape-determining protein MreC [Rickettsiales bacterium Ac37b]|nr:Rod shape-determining protein MreC [Rickettsiales bacterium Ac37b]
MNIIDRNKNFWFFRLTALIKSFYHSVILALCILIVVIFIILDIKKHHTLLTFKTTVLDFISPPIQIIYEELYSLKTAMKSLKELPNLKHENIRLKQENYLLKQQYNIALQLKIENQQLHKLLNFVHNLDYTYTTTRVINNFNTPYIKSILITAGKDCGIYKGQIVINNDGLVGRVQDVAHKTSRVLLITDLHSRVPVITINSRERGIAKGTNTDHLSLLYTTDNSNISVGEIVVTSDDGEFFPPGILVGIISEVKGGRITITPAVQLNILDTALIIGYPKSEFKLGNN